MEDDFIKKGKTSTGKPKGKRNEPEKKGVPKGDWPGAGSERTFQMEPEKKNGSDHGRG